MHVQSLSYIYVDILHSASSSSVNISSLAITLLVSDCHFAHSCIFFLSLWSILSASALAIALLRLALRKQLNQHWKDTETSEYSQIWYRSQAYSHNSERLWDVHYVSAVVCEIDDEVEAGIDFCNFLQSDFSTFSELYDIRSVFEKTERIIDLLKIFARILMKAAIQSIEIKYTKTKRSIKNLKMIILIRLKAYHI